MTDEMSGPSDEEIAQDLDLCSCVLVEIRRGAATVGESVPWTGTQIEATEAASKDIVKKKSRIPCDQVRTSRESHRRVVLLVFRFFQLKATEPPKNSWEFIEAAGGAGEPVVIKLR